MKIRYPEIGVCGLSCRLCPSYQSEGKSRCFGCKTESRMGAGCPFITCAVKKKGIEFCWDCEENTTCEKWMKHRENILKEMLREFNEGRSKSYYCISATVLEIDELEKALDEAKKNSVGLDIKGRSRILHSILEGIAGQKKYQLKLKK